MTPAETSALLNVKGLTIAELRASQPALANAVDALVSEAARKRFQVAIGALPAELQRQVAAIDLTAASGDVIAYLEAELHKRGVAEGDVAMVTRLARRAGVGGGLTPTQPVGTQPDVAAQVNMALINAHMQAVTTLAGLTDATATSVAKAVPSPSALDDTSLTALVSSGALSAAQAKTLGFTVALYKLTDENADLATAVKSGAFAALGNKAPESIDDLAKLSSADWSAFLASSKMTLPAGATQQSVAKALAARFALLSPNVALLGRLAQPAATSVTVNLATLAPLYRLNSVVVGAGFSSLVKTGLAPEQLTTMGSAQAQLQQLANAYLVLRWPRCSMTARSMRQRHRLFGTARARTSAMSQKRLPPSWTSRARATRPSKSATCRSRRCNIWHSFPVIRTYLATCRIATAPSANQSSVPRRISSTS